MNRPIVLRAAAKLDLASAYDYYEGERIGLGAEFMARVKRCLGEIAANPEWHAVVEADIRQALVTRFPYGIFYRVHSDRIEIVAVLHHKRDPHIWKRRM